MIYFLLPAYNEEKNVELQLENIRRQMNGQEFSIIVVSDGSTDRTIEKIHHYKNLTDLNISVINFSKNLGVGIAFKAGFMKLIEFIKTEDIVVTMDFDNTQSVKTINLMLSKIKEGYEVVNGSVFTMGGRVIGIPFSRLILSYICNFLYCIMFYIKGIHDFTGFFKAFSGYALKKLYERFGTNIIESTGFAVMAELLIKCRSIPLFITEVPMFVRYDAKKGKSKIKILPTIYQHVKIIIKYGILRRNIFFSS